MTPYRFRFAAGVLLAGLLLAVSPPVGAVPRPPAAQKDAAKKKPLGDPMAVVVVHAEYKMPLGKFPGATTHGAHLAAELYKAGYAVTLIVDAASAKAARDELTRPTEPKAPPPAPVPVLTEADAQKKGAKGVVVCELDTHDAVRKKLLAWMAEVAIKNPPLALMVLSGHGEERADGAHFLTVGDEPGTGGVSVAEIRGASMAHGAGLPLVVVYDGCRTPVKAAGAAPPALNVVDQKGKTVAPPPPSPPPGESPGRFEWLDRRERSFQVAAAPVSPNEVLVPTILYSTRSGDVAVAQNALVHQLALALRDRDQLDAFLAAVHGRKVQRPEILLYDWFHFAISRLQLARLEQAHQLVVGGVPLSAVVGVRAAGKVGPPRQRDTMIDLLAGGAFKDTGDFDMVYDRRTGLTITRPGGAIKAPWAAAPIGPTGGLDPTDRVLVIDLVAGFPKQKGAAPVGMKFSTNPVHRLPTVGDSLNLATGATNMDTPLEQLPFHATGQLTIPLVQRVNPATGKLYTLDAIGWAPGAGAEYALWPPNASVTVFGMKVVNKRPEHPMRPVFQRKDAGDIFPGAWCWGEVVQGDGVLRFEPAENKPGAAYRLVPDPSHKGLSRCAGRLVPHRYAAAGHVLKIDAVNTHDSRTATLTVDLLYEDPETGKVTGYAERASVTLLPKGKPAKGVPLTATGFVSYFSISTDSPGVQVKSISIQPGDAK